MKQRVWLLVAIAMGMLLPGASARAAAWLAPADLSASDNKGFLAAAMTPQGDVIVVWRAFTSPNRRVQAAVRPAGGAFGAAQDLIPASSDIDEALDVATDPAGDAIVTWRRVYAGSDIRLQSSFRPAGGSFSPGADATPAGPNVALPQVAMDGQGNAIAVWRRAPSGDDFIRYAFRPAGGTFGASQAVADVSGDSPQVGMSTAGEAIAIWSRNSTGAVEAARRPPGGAFGSAQTVSAGSVIGGPDLAVNGAGDAIAAWSRFDGSNERVEAAFAPAGGAFSSAVTLSPAGSSANGARAAIDAQGNAAVTWGRDTGTTAVVEAAFRPAGGSFAGDNPPAPADSYPSGVAFAGNGTAVLTWTDDVVPSSKLTASVRSAGGSFGPATVVSVPAEGITDSTVAGDLEGNFAAGWMRDDGAGNSTVRAAGYDGAPPRFTALSIPATAKTGIPAAFSATTFDAWSPASVTWNFGDAKTTTGNAVSHTYELTGGSRSVQATATDATGNSASAGGTVKVKDVTPVRITNVSFTPRSFAVAGRSAPTRSIRARIRRGSKLRYRLSEDATVAITVERAARGRRKGRQCVSPSRAPGGRKCTRYVRSGRLKRSGKLGKNKVKFTGKLGRRVLAPGRYRATMIATDTGALKSKRVRSRFRVVSPRR